MPPAWTSNSTASDDKHALSLTGEHRRVLRTIGRSGGTRDRLAEISGSCELQELVHDGYVWCEWSEVAYISYLTDLGASAVDIDPARIYHSSHAQSAI
jgi:hypothetical protein